MTVRRTVPNVRKAKITGEQGGLSFHRAAGDGGIFGLPKPDVPHIRRLVAVPFEQRLGGAGQVGVNDEAHGRNC